jgi:hypothetical protein
LKPGSNDSQPSKAIAHNIIDASSRVDESSSVASLGMLSMRLIQKGTFAIENGRLRAKELHIFE